MHIIDLTISTNEAVHYEYIFIILYASIFITRRITKKWIILDLQLEVVGEEASNQINYIIKKIIDIINKELIAITEGKQKNLVISFMQNIIQLESFYHMNIRKKKVSEAFNNNFDYLYKIIIIDKFNCYIA